VIVMYQVILAHETGETVLAEFYTLEPAVKYVEDNECRFDGDGSQHLFIKEIYIG